MATGSIPRHGRDRPGVRAPAAEPGSESPFASAAGLPPHALKPPQAHNRGVNPLWNELAARGRVELNPEMTGKLDRYLDLLLEANQTMNLTRITDRAAAEVGHIGDSLTLLPLLPMPPGEGRGALPLPPGEGWGEGTSQRQDADSRPNPSLSAAAHIRLADIGSGGGLPGIPIAIARPDLSVTLIDATQKKAAFLDEVARTLELSNIRVLAQRSEQLRGHQYDIVVARALAGMEQLVRYCLPLVRPGGKLLAMKGPKVHDELPAASSAIRRYRGLPPVLHDAGLPGHQHVIVEIFRRAG